MTSTAAAAAVLLATLAFAAPAGAAGGPPVPANPNAVAEGGAQRYLAVTIGARTAVLAQDVATGDIARRLDMRGRYAVPTVAYDGTAGGASTDGRTLVLARPSAAFPAGSSTFAVLTNGDRRLRLRRVLRLRGDFTYDALSPDGRTLFLIHYIDAGDPSKYRVRAYDLARNRLDREPIVDPRESPDEMNGLPLTRVASRDGRWAYTLYQGAEHAFVHALDTRRRAAVCIDLEGPAFERVDPATLRLALAPDGADLVVRRGRAPVAVVDSSTFRVGPPAPAAAPAPADARDVALWPYALALGLALAALLAGAVARRRARPI